MATSLPCTVPDDDDDLPWRDAVPLVDQVQYHEGGYELSSSEEELVPELSVVVVVVVVEVGPPGIIVGEEHREK